jgi:16S rRNA (cytosine967-C5)-methyltransferase
LKKNFIKKIHIIKEVFLAVQNVVKNKAHLDTATHLILKKNKHWQAAHIQYFLQLSSDFIRYYTLLSKVSKTQDTCETFDLWKKFSVLLMLHGKDPKEFENTRKINLNELLVELKKAIKTGELLHSYPLWLYNFCAQNYSGSWFQLAEKLNKDASIFARVNTSSTSIAQLLDQLNDENIEHQVVDWLPNAIEIKSKESLYESAAFKAGLFEIQDVASQMVSVFAQPKENTLVIDTCAGTGGKTLHLSNLMQNTGTILACDTKADKLEILKKRSKKAAAENIKTHAITAENNLNSYNQKADLVLIDAPCSGLGVLRRNPDTKILITQEGIEQNIEKQANLLNEFSQLVKPSGFLVYAVCSFIEAEGSKQIEKFLEHNKDFKLLGQKTYLPTQYNCDAFYMAKLQKIEN